MKLTLALLAALALAPLALSPAGAQSPTPEGTNITNTATASYTDANGNTYTDATASVSVTVGFAGGVDVQGTATITPSAGSTGNEENFTLVNTGNGTDQFSVGTTAGAGITITGYKIGTTAYADLAALNTALAANNVLAGANVVVTVVYSVDSGAAGTSTSLALTGTSVRDTTKTDTFTTTINPPHTTGVAVTPDAGAASRLPSKDASQTYTETFTVTNSGSQSATFSLGATAGTPAVLSIVSVNGTAGASGSITLAAGASGTVNVIYTIASGATAGATSDLTLTATDAGAGSTDSGKFTVTVIQAAVTMVKQAYLDDATTLVSGEVLPGQFIRYKITVTNGGSAAASSVSVSDPLPAQVTFASTADDGNSSPAWALSQSLGTVTGTLTSLAAGESRFFWIRVEIK